MGDAYSDESRAKIIMQARDYVYKGIEFPQDLNVTPEVQALRDHYVQVWTQRWESEFGGQWSLERAKNGGKHLAKPWTDEQRKTIEERLATRLQGLGNKLGRSPQELSVWLDKVRDSYEISDNGDKVMSYAKEYRMKNGQPQVWPVANESAAEDKIVQLLEWKISGRSVGRGDIDTDLGGQAPLR